LRGGVGELRVHPPVAGDDACLYKDPERYLETYWSRWPDVWVHGDWGLRSTRTRLVPARPQRRHHSRSRASGWGPAESIGAGGHPAVVRRPRWESQTSQGRGALVFVVPAAGVEADDGLRADLATRRDALAVVSARRGALQPTRAQTRNAKVLRRHPCGHAGRTRATSRRRRPSPSTRCAGPVTATDSRAAGSCCGRWCRRLRRLARGARALCRLAGKWEPARAGASDPGRAAGRCSRPLRRVSGSGSWAPGSVRHHSSPTSSWGRSTCRACSGGRSRRLRRLLDRRGLRGEGLSPRGVGRSGRFAFETCPAPAAGGDHPPQPGQPAGAEKLGPARGGHRAGYLEITGVGGPRRYRSPPRSGSPGGWPRPRLAAA